jgi:hypothetical protein
MHVEILIVPYDSGQENVRLGRGPGTLLEEGSPTCSGDKGMR